MNDQLKLQSLVEKDPRYQLRAYYYILETLDFARSQLGMGVSRELPTPASPGDEDSDEPECSLQHITGAELCEAVQIRARWMFGFLAKTVLNQWGIYTTDDVGEMVFNMVRDGKIRVANGDRKEDFHDLYDFQKVFCDDYSVPMENQPGGF